MYNPDEVVLEISKYLTKLSKTIMNDADFSWFGKKYVKRRRIDDILCCIEASLPSEYRENKQRRYKGMAIYRQIVSAIRVKSILSSELYSIDYAQVSASFNSFLNAVKHDLKNPN